jgi:glycosyltransferase WbpL
VNIVIIFLLSVVILIVSAILTGFIRQISINRKFYDIPNERSSHDTPTPKGGGIPIVFIFLMTILCLFYYKMIEQDLFMSMLIGTSIVSVIGFLDDYKNLPIVIRAISYVIATVFSLYILGGLSSVSINNHFINLGDIGLFLSILLIVWFINLYNFMDGTDGFAAIQTICVSLFCGLIFYALSNKSLGIILLFLAFSSAGFLYWNWAPAKIFMGDVGSCAIGFIFGLLSIYSEKEGSISIWIWLIVLAPFIGDATFTLLRRIFNKEKWYKAHNSHAYQKLHQSGLSHGKLAILLLIFNVILIWPFAYIAHVYKNYELVMLIASYCSVGVIWLLVQNKNKVIKSKIL